jgi:hypothetical protein
VRLSTTFGGAGVLAGDLTTECAVAVEIVLDALSARAGAPDTRTRAQRRHDALAEAMRRLVAAGMVPDRAGQPARVVAHIALPDLIGLDAGNALVAQWTEQARARWAAARATASHGGRDGGVWRAIIGRAVDLLSGPGGLASFLRRGAARRPARRPQPAAGRRLEREHPRRDPRAALIRDRHCRWPGGCTQPASSCHVHHVRHKARGGKTSVQDCVLLCALHHLVAIHRWGWTLALNGDGTTTAWNKDHTQVLHSHAPPTTRAG